MVGEVGENDIKKVWCQEMTSNADKTKIAGAADDVMNKSFVDAMAHEGAAVTYNPHTMVYDGHIIPEVEDVYYHDDKKNVDKYMVDMFIDWALDKSNERFIVMDAGKRIFIYQDGVYADAARRWYNATMTACNRWRNVTTAMGDESIKKLGAVNCTEFEETDYEIRDRNLTILNNCILNIDTGKTAPHTPDFVAFSKMPIAYDQTSTCPKWIEFLEYALAPSEILSIQEMFGYCLVRGYPLHVMFNMLGAGGNGKGVCTRTLEAMLGVANCSYVPLHDIEKTFLGSQLYHKYANISGDTSARDLNDLSMVKKFTGEDHVTVQYKNQDPFAFTNHAKIINLMNTMPKTLDQSAGAVRRFILIRFDKTPTPEMKAGGGEMERYIHENEMSGVLNWAIEGLQRIWAQGGFTYLLNKSIDDLRKAWNIEADHVLGFVEECCVVGGKSVIATDIFMTAYGRWHEDTYGIIPAEDQATITKSRPWAGFQKPAGRVPHVDDRDLWMHDDGRAMQSVNCYLGICLKNTPGHLSVDLAYLAENWDEIVGGASSANISLPEDNKDGDVGGDGRLRIATKQQEIVENLRKTFGDVWEKGVEAGRSGITTWDIVMAYPGGLSKNTIQDVLEEHKEALGIDNPKRTDVWVPTR